jgi:hypothetical protein
MTRRFARLGVAVVLLLGISATPVQASTAAECVEVLHWRECI